MLGRKLGFAIVATVLAAGSLTGLQGALYARVASNPRALYLWAEFKMMTGDKESASRLLQEASLKMNRVQPPAERPQDAQMQTGTCSATPANLTAIMF